MAARLMYSRLPRYVSVALEIFSLLQRVKQNSYSVVFWTVESNVNNLFCMKNVIFYFLKCIYNLFKYLSFILFYDQCMLHSKSEFPTLAHS